MDGDLDSIVHTDRNPQGAWWKVDLKEEGTVDQVRLVWRAALTELRVLLSFVERLRIDC